MKIDFTAERQFFFATTPLPCPYLPDRLERRVLAEISGPGAARLHDRLAQAGFRRSHRVVYSPACPRCNACRALRVLVADFTPSRTQRRLLRRNAGLKVRELRPVASAEQYDLFVSYQRSRHASGEMAKMDFIDYRAMVEESSIDTRLIEVRDAERRLVAVCLVDRVGDGFSAVYSFFDPEAERASLGTWLILSLIERAAAIGAAHVYLGYWVETSAKMSYKASFSPAEIYTPAGWRRLVVPPPTVTAPHQDLQGLERLAVMPLARRHAGAVRIAGEQATAPLIDRVIVEDAVEVIVFDRQIQIVDRLRALIFPLAAHRQDPEQGVGDLEV